MHDKSTRPPNRFDLPEWAGAFGDLGTLIPFVAAYVSILKMDANGLLVAFGVSLIVAGTIYRTPFPVQPMKAIGAAAVSQTMLAAGLGAAAVVGAALTTGLLWLFLAVTGLGRQVASWVPRSALLGVVMGLGFSFMLEGIRMMSTSPWIAGLLLALTLVLLGRPRVPAMLVLLVIGVLIALTGQPDLMRDLGALKPEFKVPSLAWGSLSMSDLWVGFVLLTLPQLPLTFGNAYVAITEENNRLFPDRPVTERAVAYSTGLMNLGSSLIGGIPMCHGAGGMAGHVQFGARTGGSSIILGSVLLGAGLFLSASIGTVFKMFPPSVLGVILFMAGLQLALGSRDSGTEKADRFVVLATAAFAIWNVGAAVLFGILAHQASQRGWLRL
ncbi:MAG: sulfate transporter [Betaproteobacteria bacterium RIFCSPLOWO2_12_FULL_64_23]|nr:MAG: sulfate transporter [Betaproteobacteria bacterium RIFCSPLOWO2_12_FULL_64_23]